jgi:hypothetical protein
MAGRTAVRHKSPRKAAKPGGAERHACHDLARPHAILFCFVVGAGAQARKGLDPPTVADQQTMLAHLDDYLRHPPDFVCTPQTLDVNDTEAVQASRQLRNNVHGVPEAGGSNTGRNRDEPCSRTSASRVVIAWHQFQEGLSAGRPRNGCRTSADFLPGRIIGQIST